MPKYLLSYIDTCNSQYFAGHRLPVISVMVDKYSTYDSVKTELLESSTTEHLWEDTYFTEGFNFETYVNAVEEAFLVASLVSTWDNALEASTDDEYDVYAYFTLQALED